MTGILGFLVTTILNWLWGKISTAIAAYFSWRSAKSKIEEKAKEVREKTEKAETKEERDDAAHDVIDNW